MTNPLKKISTKIFELGERKRELELETNKAQSIYDVETKKAGEAAVAATALQQRVEDLVVSVEEAEGLGLEGVKKASEAIASATEILREIGKISEGALESVKKVDAVIAKRMEELKLAKEEDAQRTLLIVKEGEKLNILKKDLDIYRNRLQTRYNELGLGELIL